MLEVKDLSKTVNGEVLLDKVTFQLKKGDKAIFVGDNEIAISTLFQILMGETEADSGTFRWGVTTTQSYLPKDHNPYFEGKKVNLIDWLREFSEDKSEHFIRTFFGPHAFFR